MNDQKVEKRIGKLEQLTEEQQKWILETALNSRLTDMTIALRKEGIDTSPASLSRFIRKHQEKELLAEGEASRGSVEAFAARGRSGRLREGTLEAVRQRLYERALVSQSPEEARELFAELVREEGKLREMELEARRVAIAEQQVSLQHLKLQVLLRQAEAGGKGRTRATVVVGNDGGVVEGAAATGGELTNGNGGSDARDTRNGSEGSDGSNSADGAGGGERAMGDAASGGGGADDRAGVAPGDPRAVVAMLLGELNEIANRGGAAEERVVELRARLAEAAREVASASQDTR